MQYSDAEETNLLREARVTELLDLDHFDVLRARYREKHRAYHTWDHALDVLKATLGLPLEPLSRRAYTLAALFHDAVYKIGEKDCEQQSVDLMRQMGIRYPLAEDLILATATHSKATRENTHPAMWDFLDCDILGMADPSWPIVSAKDLDVITEYTLEYSTETIIVGRVAFLTAWLTKPSIFLGDVYGPTHEWQIRQNLCRLINQHNTQNLRGNS